MKTNAEIFVEGTHRSVLTSKKSLVTSETENIHTTD